MKAKKELFIIMHGGDGRLGDDVLEGGGGDEENLGVVPALHPQCEVVVPDHISAQPKWFRSSRTSKVPEQ